MRPTIQLEEIPFTISKDLDCIDFMRNWKTEMMPHVKKKEVLDALQTGFRNYFQSEEEWKTYNWKKPRLDRMGRADCKDLHEIMDEPTFREYLNHDYEEIDKYFRTLHNRRRKDWVKPNSYFAYRAIGCCFSLASFCYEIGKLLYPDFDWYILNCESHANAIGVSNGEIVMVSDLLWGDFVGGNPHKILSNMVNDSIQHCERMIKWKKEEDESRIEVWTESIQKLKRAKDKLFPLAVR